MHRAGGRMRTDATRALVLDFDPGDDHAAAASRDATLVLLDGAVDPFHRSTFDPGHVTGSAIVFDPAGTSIVLVEHARVGGWVQPGGHRSPLRELYAVDRISGEGVLKTLDDTPWPADEDALALEVPAGSVVFFHDHMPHCSSQNRSDRSRQAFTMHVAESGAAWSGDNWLQRPGLGAFML